MSIYDEKPPMGQFIKIEAGKSVKLRLVGDGHAFNKDFKGDISRRFLSVVLYRNTATKTSEVKIFEFGWQVMSHLNKLLEDEDFGHPSGYDVKISREGEGMQTKYFVQALAKKPITPEELALVDSAGIDLEAIARKGSEPVAAAPATAETYNPFDDE